MSPSTDSQLNWFSAAVSPRFVAACSGNVEYARLSGLIQVDARVLPGSWPDQDSFWPFPGKFLGRDHGRALGNRFAALEPVAQGLGRLYGSVEADVARGLALRMDHGSQYLSDHFLNQLRYWGIHPSFGFLEEPETNGVVERWNRTLKEQAIYGRVFQNLADVRTAVAEFVERYNQRWRLEKLAYQTPLEAREEYELRHRVAQMCVQETGGAVHPQPGARPPIKTGVCPTSVSQCLA